MHFPPDLRHAKGIAPITAHGPPKQAHEQPGAGGGGMTQIYSIMPKALRSAEHWHPSAKN